MNWKFFLCSYELLPLKYTILKFEMFWVKIGDVTGVQSYAIFPKKWSSNRMAKMPRDVTLCWLHDQFNIQYSGSFSRISTFSWFLEVFRIARHHLSFGAARTH